MAKRSIKTEHYYMQLCHDKVDGSIGSEVWSSTKPTYKEQMRMIDRDYEDGELELSGYFVEITEVRRIYP